MLKRMENYQGDLGDILRNSGKTTSDSSPITEWQFPNEAVSFTDPVEDFGDPFTLLGDPLLHDIDTPVPILFHKARGGDEVGHENSNHVAHDDKMIDDDHDNIINNHEMMMIRPTNLFSRMLQVSPTQKLCDSTATTVTNTIGCSKLVTNQHDRSLVNSSSGSKGSLVQSLQISSSTSRNPGIKRRKSQAKKVVCIPAPAPANSRSSGEVVPSDLWAWRKYGQKPIKGSPYPRGYYRCSSSKGCSARKQVERSRTDPNMLVITYTSEHNHPWPTQRNSLAGSTRSHQATTKLTNSSTKTPSQKPTTPKEEPDTNPENLSPETMKQEIMNDAEYNEGFSTSYKPALAVECASHPEDNFFAELGEIDADPLDLLFGTQGFSVGGDDRENKALDPFSFYDWPGNSSGTTSAATSYGDQAKRDS